MSVDCDGIGGVGIEFTKQMAQKAIDDCIFTEKEYDDDARTCLLKLTKSIKNSTYSVAGSCYSGVFRYYFMVEGKTLGEITKNSIDFCQDLKQLGVDVTVDQLNIIEDLYVS